MPNASFCADDRLRIELGQHTRSEIYSQPDAWAATLNSVMARADSLREFFGAGKFQATFFTGCGSTYYLALAAAALFEELLGLPARALPASELWLNPRLALSPGPTLLIAISRSGETTETLRACERLADSSGCTLLTLSCYPDHALATRGRVNLVLPAGQEKSIAQTRAFTSLYLACVALIALWADRDDVVDQLARLPEIGRRLLAEHAGRARSLGQRRDLDRFYFLGSGARYGLACELSLKMKEMSLSHSEPFHFMEFRHGPQSMVTPTTLITGLVSEANRTPECRVLEEMRELGAHVLAIGEMEAGVAFESGIEEPARNVLYLPIGQLLAFEHALARGLDPDAPRHLDAVVKLADR